MMRGLLTVWAKEMLENARDRRTLLSALIFGPLFGPIMFAFLMTLTLDRAVTQSDRPVELAVSGAQRAPNLLRVLKEHGVSVESLDVDADRARSAIAERKKNLILLIPAEYAQRFAAGQPAPLLLFSDSSDSRAAKYAARVRAILEGYGAQLGASRLLARGIQPLTVKPLAVDMVDVSTPAGRSVLLLGMVTYFILFAMLMGGLYLTIDATAGERERGSLEALLSTPIAREAIIYGKVLAACTYMLLSLAITVAAFSVSLRWVPLEALGMSANFSPWVACKLFAVVLPFVWVGAGLMTVVASFTRTYKEAQSYLSIVLLVPTLPIVFAGLYSLRPSAALMLVPSLSQHLLMTDLLRDEPLQWNFLGISVGTSLAVGLALTWLAGRLYRREAILG